jgi:hypothetical protein
MIISDEAGGGETAGAAKEEARKCSVGGEKIMCEQAHRSIGATPPGWRTRGDQTERKKGKRVRSRQSVCIGLTSHPRLAPMQRLQGKK